MQWYTSFVSRPDLDEIVSCTYTATPGGSHRLVPDACIDLVWVTTGDLFVCGPETTGWDFELPVGVASAGVRFRPGVAPAVLGFSALHIGNSRVRLRNLLDESTESALVRRLQQAPSLDEQRLQLEDFVARFVADVPPCATDLAFSDRVLDVLASSPRADAAQLAAHMAMTVRQLHRRCLNSFGYGPSVLARLLRMQRFLALASTVHVTPSAQRLARLAADAGYSDQAHLTRECRAISGDTPAELLARYFPTFPDMSDPFKTAEPFAVTMTA